MRLFLNSPKSAMIMRTACLCLISLLVGCGATGKQIDVRQLEAEQIRTYVHLRFLDKKELKGVDYERLGTVEGTSCLDSTRTGRVASKGDARDQLKVRAARLQADGVVNVLCEHHPASIFSDCQSAWTCVGEAIRVLDHHTLTKTPGPNGRPAAVAVVAANHAPTEKHEIPAGKIEGAVQMAKDSVSVGPLANPAALWIAPVFAAGGLVMGAATTDSLADVQVHRDVVDKAFVATPALQVALRDYAVAYARELYNCPCKPVPATAHLLRPHTGQPEAQDNAADELILELAVDEIGLQREYHGGPARLSISGHVRIARAGDGLELDYSQYRQVSVARELPTWANHNAAFFKRVLDSELHRLAKTMVDGSFRLSDLGGFGNTCRRPGCIWPTRTSP